jgi:predicted nucleic acid-binding protein
MRSMPDAEPAPGMGRVLLDAGIFIGALLAGDPRPAEARPLVEQARQGTLLACSTAGILSEVYGGLTREKAEPRQDPAIAAEAVRLSIEPPSAVIVLLEDLEVGCAHPGVGRHASTHGKAHSRCPTCRRSPWGWHHDGLYLRCG